MAFSVSSVSHLFCFVHHCFCYQGYHTQYKSVFLILSENPQTPYKVSLVLWTPHFKLPHLYSNYYSWIFTNKKHTEV